MDHMGTHDEESISLFDQLTASQDSLDKFQSSVKSASEAYTTLLSGNYSTSELLDSIQTINQAVTDMGGSLDWEFFANQSQMDSLELLGGAIEHISQKYAESILSGAGIDVNSEFGQMLAKMVQEAYEAEAEFAGMNAQLDNLQSSYQTLTGILESYNETGYISLDNLQSLLTADENLIAMLEVENGQLAINQEAYENLVAAQLMEFKAKLNDAAAAEIETLAKQKAEQATNQNADASNNAVEKLDAETAAFNRNTSAAISNAIAKAEENGVSEEEIQGVLDKYNEVWNATVNNFSGDFDGFMGGDKASKAGSKAADAYLEAFQKEYDHLKELLDRGEISEAQYLNRLRALYTRYFKDRKEYLDEYKKYESEYLSGMLDLHNKALSGISTLLNKKISAANDAKDSAISALEEEKEAAAEAYQTQIDAIEEEKDAIDELIKEKEKKIEALNEEADAIQKAAETRKKNIDLQKEEYNLERMLNQRTTAVYKEGEGFVFETDTSGIRDAREKVKEAKEELEIDRLQKKADLIQKEIDLLEEKKDALTEEQDTIQKMMDESNKYYDNLIKQQEKMWDSMISGMEQQKAKWEELADIQEIAEAYSAVQQVFGELGYSVEEVLNGSESAFEDFRSKYISLISDVNSNSDFTDGLVYATGVAKENLGSFLDKTKETSEGIDELASKGTELGTVAEGINGLATSASDANTNLTETASTTSEVASNVGSIAESLNQIPDSQNITNLTGAFDTLAESIGKVAEALGLDGEAEINTLFQTMSDLNSVTFGNEDEGIIGQFTLLKTAITDVINTIGLSGEQTVGSLMQAISELNTIALGDNIITQFNNLKTAIDSVTFAISGGGESSGSEGQGSNTGSSKGGESGGIWSNSEGGGNSLTGAIESMGETANEVIGEPDAEGDGTVIGEFGSLETAVNDVSSAISGGDSENGGSHGKGEIGSDNLIGSIVDLGETTEETLGNPDGKGVIGRFGQFKEVIGEANEHVSGIADGLAAIDGKEVECTIRVNIETTGGTAFTGSAQVLGSMNLNSATYNAQYKGSAHYEGTAEVTGDWGVRNAGKTLVGELGQEIVVRGSRFFTVGDNGAEFVNLQKGDIVFNHLQTKELLSKGNYVGRGKAYASGTVNNSGVSAKQMPIEPVYPEMDRWERMEKLAEALGRDVRELILPLNSLALDVKKETGMGRLLESINNVNNVTNNSNKPSINIGDIHVTCPGVTSQQVAEQLGNVIGQELNKQFNGFSLYTDQMSRIR